MKMDASQVLYQKKGVTISKLALNLLSKEPRPLEELIRPAFFVPESMHTDTLFHEMQRRKDHIAIVVDE